MRYGIRKRGRKFSQEGMSTNMKEGGRQTGAGSGLAGGGMWFTDGPK